MDYTSNRYILRRPLVAAAGSNTITFTLPVPTVNETEITDVHVSFANTTAPRGRVVVDLYDSGLSEVIEGIYDDAPVTADHITLRIPNNTIPLGTLPQIRVVFADCTITDVLHATVSYTERRYH